MRNFRKNQRTLWFASYLRAEPILDEYGNETLEVKKVYSKPQELKINISANVGEEATHVFGDVSQYSRILTYVGAECPLKEQDELWINKDPTEKANYEVVKVADSVNSWMIGVRETV